MLGIVIFGVFYFLCIAGAIGALALVLCLLWAIITDKFCWNTSSYKEQRRVGIKEYQLLPRPDPTVEWDVVDGELKPRNPWPGF